MKKLIFAVVILGVITVGPVVAYLMFSGPRMRDQVKILPYQAVMPLSPENAVPLNNPVPALPAAKSVEKLNNPLKPTAENLARGKIYYGYYCLFCHGEDGRSVGPVGESYFPAPADLHSAKIQKYSDGKLFRAMLTGVGHEPVLPRVVPPEHRWPIVLFLHHLPDSSK